MRPRRGSKLLAVRVIRTVTPRGTSRASWVAVNKIILAILLSAAAACSRGAADPSQSASEAALPSGLHRVTDASQVCMVNDQFMGRPQIAVPVAGKTYFGCCPACKEKLEHDPQYRTARDPVSGAAVDKASAVIAQDASGKVLYFASEDTLKRYRE